LQETNRKLAIADSNRRKLLANISHEFRTPLTVIRGEAEIALRGFSKNNDGHRESFRRIVDQAVNATRLVDDLLFIARVDAGEPRFKASSVAISSMVDSVCQELNANAGRKRIKIEQLEMAPGAIVQGDERRLRQVFTIILDNAIKYSNPDGLIKIQVLQRKRSVEVMIKDQGIGLEEGEAEMAFERFYRAPAATDKAAGTGLGLPVAKAIVEAHNGTISLEGKPGEGVTATVVLPFGREFGIVT
jgi:signal transduction histidine kinase